MPVNRTAPARLPLNPGRPLVYRCRRRGAWGFFCNCLAAGSLSGTISAEEPNADSWRDALRAALIHVRYAHKTPAQLEVEQLEAAYALPAATRAA